MTSNFRIYKLETGEEVTVLSGRVIEAAGFLSRDAQGSFAVVVFMDKLVERNLATIA